MSKDKTDKDLRYEQMAGNIAKFDTPEEEHISKRINLPHGYDHDRIVLMVRDPWWIFTYWEIAQQKEDTVKKELQRRKKKIAKSVLRVYEVTGVKNFNGTNARRYFDIELKNMARSWCIDTGTPNSSWCVEIGILSEDGEFFALARSNIVKTPRFGPSDLLDETWMCQEDLYWKLFGASGGFDIGKSSMEMKEIFQKRLTEWVTSGAFGGSASFILTHKK
ncbi:MAG: DUF4912 domain-containing protein [Candidatus Omnitrophica bacterium]|nr:DUF4912 domain-containing protein [Candidatus Omnitrophota bacterium]